MNTLPFNILSAIFAPWIEWTLDRRAASEDLNPLRLRADRVKPFVMARKNFLFSGSGIGAKSTCFIFTLIETAKANNKNPEDYLRCLFEKAPYAQTDEDWNKLLPWNIEITPFKMRGEWVE